MPTQSTTPAVDPALLQKARTGDFYAKAALLDQVTESGGLAMRMVAAALAPPEPYIVRAAMLGGFDASRMGPNRWGDDRDRWEDDWSPVPISKAVAYVQGIWPEHDAMALVANVMAGPDAPPLVDEMFWHPAMVEAIAAVLVGSPESAVQADGATWQREVTDMGSVCWTTTNHLGYEDTWWPGSGPMARTRVSSGAVAAEERRHKPFTGSRANRRTGRGRR